MFEKEFGFYPYASSFETDRFSIRPLPGLEDAKSVVEADYRIWKDWILPPFQTAHVPSKAVNSPLKPSQVVTVEATRFDLPTTHAFRHKTSKSEDLVNFLILCFGFFVGMRTVPAGWGHFYKTPACDHKLADFITGRSDVERCLLAAEKFWNAHRRSLTRVRMFSAIHTFQTSRSYEHEFEEFTFLYTTLDTCVALLRELDAGVPGRLPHWQYAAFMCHKLGIPVPSWTPKYRKHEYKRKPKVSLSVARNKLIHEGLVSGAPLGFGVIGHPGNINLELRALTGRAIIYLMGIEAGYTSTRIDTRQPHGLGLVN